MQRREPDSPDLAWSGDTARISAALAPGSLAVSLRSAHCSPFTSHVPLLADESDWLAVAKPAGLLAHPTRPGGPRTLLGLLREYFAADLAAPGTRIALAHRLDRETSGVTLAAKTPAAARHFGLEWMAGRVRKEYRALVFGWPAWEEETVSAPLRRAGEVEASAVWLRQAVHPGGAPAETRFRVERRTERAGRRVAVLAAWPRTGRLHQIRVHAAFLGHPLVGDKLYGADPAHAGWYLRFLAEGWTPAHAAALLLPRHALHARRLEFTAPDGMERAVTAPPPDDLPELTE